MRKITALFCAIFLASCSPYAPHLAEQPKDQAKYEADKKYCITTARERKEKADLLASDDFKMPVTMADECMAQKGYSVISRWN